MSAAFLEQPLELIANEQLVRLSIKDLLSVCITSSKFNELCKKREIWIARIQNEYPGVSVPDIRDSKEFYLQQKLFGGEIYGHYYADFEGHYYGGVKGHRLGGRLNAKTEQIAKEIIEYKDLFVRVKEIAETLKPDNTDYLITYSRPNTYSNIDLDIIGYQIEDYILLKPGPLQKITLIDIVYLHPNSSIFPRVHQIRKLTDAFDKNRKPFTINGRQYTPSDLIYEIRYFFSSLQLGTESLLSYHEAATTVFYQRETKFSFVQREIASRLTRVPKLSDICGNGDVEVRKMNMINFIVNRLQSTYFINAQRTNLIYGFSSYANFKTFQENHVNSMNEDQLRSLEALRGLFPVIPMVSVFGGEMSGFVFDYDGDIIFV